jgi:predicted ArsR family transcriptional regulator
MADTGILDSAHFAERLLETLRARGPISHVQLGRALGVDRLPVRVALERLQRRGLVRRVGEAHTRRGWGAGAPETVWEATRADEPR